MPINIPTHVIFFFIIILGLSRPNIGLADSQDASQHKLEQLKKNIKKINKWLSKANLEKSGLSRELERQEREINRVSKNIRAVHLKISNQTKEIKRLKTLGKQQKTSLNQQKEFLIKQLRTAYLQGNQPAIKMLLDDDAPQDIARYMHFFSYINNARNEKITTFQSSLAQLKATETNVLKQQTKLNKNRRTLETDRKNLRQNRKKRKKVLAQLGNNIKNNAQRLKNMKADQSRLKKLLIELEHTVASIPTPANATPFKQQKYKLPWPSRGKVIARFGSRIAQGKLKLNGIRIATKENSTVTAIHHGRIIFSNWIRGFGLLIIIDHGDNYMSLYGNNKSLVKETGDWVGAGETIAYSNKSSTKNESGLYFEIRKNGKPLNPSQWLRK
ncbi:MAG: septal ring factor EnvC (AmiA/AmiB activator) [Oleiphilaceae bacterium]|jgi:septal ring factor EnvC (AmiA/AmiB activator)